VKILQIAPRLPSYVIGEETNYVGGGNTYPVNLSLHLAKLGHQVTLITASAENEDSIQVNSRFLIKPVKALYKPEFALGRSNPFSYKLVYQLLKEDYDILHVHQIRTFFNLLSCVLSRFRNIPSIATDHGGGGILFPKVNPYYLGCFFPHAIAAVSKAHLMILKKFIIGKKRCYVIHGGVDCDTFKPTARDPNLVQELGLEGVTTILFVGRLLPQKGLDKLLCALRLIKDSHVKLLLVGCKEDINFFAFLRYLVRKYRLEEKVIFQGYVSSKRLPKFYNLCDVFVLPSVFVDYIGVYRQFPEQFPLVTLEAMACGKPVVASDVTGISEQVISEQTGFIVEPGNVKALASKLKELLQDEKVKEHMGRNARDHVTKNFSWQIIAEKALKCYRDLLEVS
jgi:glycosyltransferase involved in cell wall biosynthesis